LICLRSEGRVDWGAGGYDVMIDWHLELGIGMEYGVGWRSWMFMPMRISTERERELPSISTEDI